MSQRFPPTGGVGGPTNSTTQGRYQATPPMQQPSPGAGPMRPYTAAPPQSFSVSQLHWWQWMTMVSVRTHNFHDLSRFLSLSRPNTHSLTCYILSYLQPQRGYVPPTAPAGVPSPSTLHPQRSTQPSGFQNVSGRGNGGVVGAGSSGTGSTTPSSKRPQEARSAASAQQAKG